MHLLNTLPQRLDPGATPTFTGLLTGDGTAAAPSLSFAADTDTGWYRAAANQIRLALGGNGVLTFTSTGNISSTATGATLLLSDATGAIGLTAAGTNQNITLTPSGTGVVSVVASAGLRLNSANSSLGLYTDNGTDWVGLRVVSAAIRVDGGTIFPTGGIDLFTASNSGLRIQGNGRVLIGTLADSGALLQVGTNTTTSAGGMVFGTDVFAYRSASNGFTLSTSSSTSLGFIIAQSGGRIGAFQVDTANVYLDSQTTGAGLVFRTNGTTTALTLDSSQGATFASHVATAATASFGWIGRGGIYAPADGVFRLANNSGTDFSRLQFGGTTSSFPSLKRNGTALEVRLADDSSHAAMFVSTLGFGAVGTFTGAADGVFLMRDNAATSFGRLQFGGTTSSFPALSRSGVRLVARLADDSSVAELEGALVSAGAAVTVGASRIAYGGTTSATVGAAGGASALPATPTGYIIVNVAGTNMKVPYYAN